VDFAEEALEADIKAEEEATEASRKRRITLRRRIFT
jgi:hypothetical protein